MASAHHISFLDNVQLTNENLRELLFDAATGEPVASNFDAVNPGSVVAVTATQTLSSKSIDHILVGNCVGCTLNVTLQISPDGVNWTDCTLANGDTCQVDCSLEAGDCQASIIDVPLLQYVRIKVLPSATGTDKICTVNLHFTLN
jgi:hypothetical protein